MVVEHEVTFLWTILNRQPLQSAINGSGFWRR
jgi:hypothetical protein